MNDTLKNLARFFVGPQPDEEPPVEPVAPAKRRSTVLVIDDDPSMLQTLRLLLYEAGFEVLTSSSGLKGLDMLRYAPRPFDAVLLDFNMPGFDGGKTLPYIRQLAPQAKIICVSGSQPEDLPPDLRQGVDRLIHKPFTLTQLVSCLTGIVGSSSAPDAAGPAKSNR